MHKFAFLNQRISPVSKINLSAISAAALYGKGIFTTVAIYRRKPFLWEKHWRRLQENAQKIEIDFRQVSESSIKNALFELIAANKIENARARITIFDESPTKIWNADVENKTTVFVISDDFKNTKENFNLTVSPYFINSASPLVNVKSCNYLEKYLMIEDARKRDFDEAVCLNEKGEIVSGVMANLFWIKDEKLFTPPLKSGCLAGTTRELLIENFAVQEKIGGLKDLFEADEVFLTSAGIGLKNVAKIDKKVFGKESFSQLRSRFEAFI